MTRDARFEDVGEHPLRLRALDPEDADVISSLVQDAVLPGSEIRWQKRGRRLALLINRFRWEHVPAQIGPANRPERVQSVLAIEDVHRVRSQGLDQADSDTILSILRLGFEPGPDGTGAVEIILSGDGVIRADVEALEITLRDVTRPYTAPSGQVPGHPV